MSHTLKSTRTGVLHYIIREYCVQGTIVLYLLNCTSITSTIVPYVLSYIYSGVCQTCRALESFVSSQYAPVVLRILESTSSTCTPVFDDTRSRVLGALSPVRITFLLRIVVRGAMHDDCE